MPILTSKIISGLKNCRFMGIKRIFPNPNHLETGFLTLNISSNRRLSDKQLSEIILFKETENIKRKMILVNDFVCKSNLSKEEIIRQLNSEGVNIENIPVIASSSFMDDIRHVPNTFSISILQHTSNIPIRISPKIKKAVQIGMVGGYYFDWFETQKVQTHFSKILGILFQWKV